ncbi:Smr protein/MutS2 [Sphingobium chlorophenolicum L-1]|uniref:Smr protein/MutS2 n=1 Tax=Sphingobium chlorophenolicum L-1 TaxID=690566 RepID=F6ESQ3_SPHCR|nr:Smr/MutS family protein [Sphingobium chlorophenolicum]AEG47712.1 Smr protein/MutS2 [Sphingobium chlorophenolicum L-1]
MGRRNLSSDEQALWTALTRSVRPLRPGARTPALPVAPVKATDVTRLTLPPVQTVAAPPLRTPAAILDSGWERRIRSGNLMPDMTIDLHGHSLAAAHARLNQALATAWARDARVMLVVTGKPPKTASVGASRRGAIRAEIGHWLETGSYADRIASVRIAHPRHGGDGAIYVILRRKK